MSLSLTTESTPPVHDGVMFVFGYGDRAQAIDAATGDLLWQDSRQLPQGMQPSYKRDIALYGDKVYLATSDVHLVALDSKTGRVAWDHSIGGRKDFNITGGPLAAKGKIMQGVGGSMDRWFRARDASNGKVLWDIRLNDVPNSAPISYTAGGKQYVAITVGNGGAIPATWVHLIPDIRNPDGGASVWAFEVPDRPTR